MDGKHVVRVSVWRRNSRDHKSDLGDKNSTLPPIRKTSIKKTRPITYGVDIVVLVHPVFGDVQRSGSNLSSGGNERVVSRFRPRALRRQSRSSPVHVLRGDEEVL